MSDTTEGLTIIRVKQGDDEPKIAVLGPERIQTIRRQEGEPLAEFEQRAAIVARLTGASVLVFGGLAEE